MEDVGDCDAALLTFWKWHLTKGEADLNTTVVSFKSEMDVLNDFCSWNHICLLPYSWDLSGLQ
jgi:hypothetical protein